MSGRGLCGTRARGFGDVTATPSPLSPIIEDLERLVQRADRGEIPALLGALERVRVMAWMRLSAPQVATRAPTRPRPGKDRLLSAKEAAELLNVSERWTYDHADELGGQRLTPRCLRFSESALRRWLEARRP